MNPKLSDRMKEIAANYENEYEYAVFDAMDRESELHDGLYWVETYTLANELWSVMLGEGVEVESGSPIDDLMSAVVLLAYDQAMRRAAKVLNIPFKELRNKDYDLYDKEEQAMRKQGDLTWIRKTASGNY